MGQNLKLYIKDVRNYISVYAVIRRQALDKETINLKQFI